MAHLTSPNVEVVLKKKRSMNTSNYAHCDRLKITKQKLKFTSNFLEVNMFEKKCKLQGIKGKDDKPHMVAILVVNSRANCLLYFIREQFDLPKFAVTNLSNIWK